MASSGRLDSGWSERRGASAAALSQNVLRWRVAAQSTSRAAVVMKNKKLILINGMSRSGSNLLWNILQSHPGVCSPVGETRSVLHPGAPGMHRLSRFIYRHFATSAIINHVDRRLYDAKLRNINHESNRDKTENEPYTVDEIRSSVLCTKSLNEDIYLTDFFYSIYDDIYTIGLVRNGYALCEGRIRRGEKPDKIGRDYAKYISKIVDDSNRLNNYRVVKFEEILQQPFEVAESLFQFCSLEPERVEKLRLKSKTIMSSNGEHSKEYKDVGGKYWFDRKSISIFIDRDVDEAQAGLLSARDRRLFEKQAKPILEYFSYA